MIAEDKDRFEVGGMQRARESRRLRSLRRSTIDSFADDLPVFLAEPDRMLHKHEASSDLDESEKGRFSLPSKQIGAALAAHYVAAKDRLLFLSRPAPEPDFLWTKSAAHEGVARIALVIFLLPLLFLMMPSERPHSVKTRVTKAAAPIRVPEFNLEERLAFAQGLRDGLVASAIKADFEDPKAVAANAPGSAPSTPPQTQRFVPKNEIAESANAVTAPAIAVDDREWGLPFDSQRYQPADLPETPASSFISELSVSPLLDEGPQVAATDPSTDRATQPQKAKPEKRRKVLAQRKRGPPANQMAAAAAPAATPQGQPNLPPPPILFFLGAPPPAASSQPATSAQQPQASSTPLFQPTSPPQNSSWLPDSLSDSVRNRY